MAEPASEQSILLTTSVQTTHELSTEGQVPAERSSKLLGHSLQSCSEQLTQAKGLWRRALYKKLIEFDSVIKVLIISFSFVELDFFCVRVVTVIVTLLSGLGAESI